MAHCPLSVERPGWIAYAAALKAATDRFQSTSLAIAKLDSASQARSVRCNVESIGNPPELSVQPNDQSSYDIY